MKYYAVKCGRVPGVYTSWPECEAQVKGFAGAKYKSFKTEADACGYLNDSDAKPVNNTVSTNAPAKTLDLSIPEGAIAVYVDGSWHPQCPDVFGYGFHLQYPDGHTLDYSCLVQDQPDMAKMRNVAGEISAAIDATECVLLNHLGNYPNLDNCPKIVIFHDYKGIAHWVDPDPAMGRSWTCKNKYTKYYRSVMRTFRAQGIDIEFRHVPGHTGIPGNERADRLANKAFEGLL